VGARPTTARLLRQADRKELWHSVSGRRATRHRFAPLQIIKPAGVRQLIGWNIKQVSSLDPATGKIYWQVRLR